jgi:hypothetical protein
MPCRALRWLPIQLAPEDCDLAIFADARPFEEVETRYEDSALLRYVAHSHDCARSRRNTNKATDRQREAVRSDEAESARWLQAHRNGQGNEALGGRMHGDAGAKNRYAI